MPLNTVGSVSARFSVWFSRVSAARKAAQTGHAAPRRGRAGRAPAPQQEGARDAQGREPPIEDARPQGREIELDVGKLGHPDSWSRCNMHDRRAFLASLAAGVAAGAI